MPTSQRSKRHVEYVDLAPGITIPTEFTSMRPMDGSVGSYTVHIRTDPEGREPTLVDFSMHFSYPPPIRAVTNDQIRRLAEHEISQQAVKVATERLMTGHRFAVSDDFADYFPEVDVPPGTAVLPSAELARIGDAAVAAIKPKPGRRPVSDDFKLRVLEIFRTHGINEAKAQTGKQERTVRRYIAQARKIERGEH